MSRRCEMCGKATSFGRQYSRRGKAKRDGGVGVKITGKSRRTFKPNIQRVRAVVDGEAKRIKVCTSCLTSGKVQKPAPKS